MDAKGGCRLQWGERFISAQQEVLWTDYGSDFYAAQMFNGLPCRRRVWLAWMNNWQYATKVPTNPWRSQMTIPRELFLLRTAHGLRLAQRPAVEILQLRGASTRWSEIRISQGRHTLAAPDTGAFEMEMVLAPEKGSQCGFFLGIPEMPHTLWDTIGRRRAFSLSAEWDSMRISIRLFRTDMRHCFV